MIALDATPPAAPKWERIALPDIGSFDVILKEPTYAETVAVYMETNPARSALLMLACVTGWSGVQDDTGKHVEFTTDALGLAIRQWPGFFDAVLPLVRKLFEPVKGTDRKNSSAPPSAETAETQP